METPDLQKLLADARDIVTVKRVYGEPYEHDGLTVIPAATVRGGAGGGAGRSHDEDTGGGGGFGLAARPTGAWIVEDGKATWKPAVDVNKIVLGGQIVALTAILVAARLLHEQSKLHSRRSGPRARALRACGR